MNWPIWYEYSLYIRVLIILLNLYFLLISKYCFGSLGLRALLTSLIQAACGVRLGCARGLFDMRALPFCQFRAACVCRSDFACCLSRFGLRAVCSDCARCSFGLLLLHGFLRALGGWLILEEAGHRARSRVPCGGNWAAFEICSCYMRWARSIDAARVVCTCWSVSSPVLGSLLLVHRRARSAGLLGLAALCAPQAWGARGAAGLEALVGRARGGAPEWGSSVSDPRISQIWNLSGNAHQIDRCWLIR